MSQRRFFQLHLSTAFILMLVAAVLVWANVRKQPGDRRLLDESVNEPASRNPDFEVAFDSHGWPFRSHWTSNFWRDIKIDEYVEWRSPSTVYNSLIALAILLALWQLCEWRIRRREAK